MLQQKICPTKRSNADIVQTKNDDTEETRPHWTGKLDFLLSLIGYSISLSNVWRFPYIIYRNGGGAFLIPYWFFLITCGIPLFLMEVSIGQFSSCSPLKVWKISPMFKGLGYAMLIVSMIGATMSNVIMTWVFYYFFESFSTNLGWGSCGNSWNTPRCSTLNTTNSSDIVVAAKEFFERRVLDLSGGIEEVGSLKPELVGCLALTWVVTFVCIFRGIRLSGKIVYVTATLPYALLVILCIRGALLPGSLKGVIYYLTPKWELLLDYKVWAEACLQAFYSLGPAWGGLITMASYNRFHHNCFRTSIFIPIIDAATSCFAGFVIFSVIGYMSHVSGVAIDKLLVAGPGLAFVVYPAALSTLPIPQLWSVIFFLTLLTLGVDSQFTTFETVTSAIVDEFPRFLRGWIKTLYIALACVTGFLLCLPCVTRAGMYIFQFIDWYYAAFVLFTITLLECISIGWSYGSKRLSLEIEIMTNHRLSIVWRILWQFVSPAFIFVMLVTTLAGHSTPVLGNMPIPHYIIVIGWFLAIIPVSPIPIYMLHKLINTPGTLLERLRQATTASADWGPADEDSRQECLLRMNELNNREQLAVNKQQKEACQLNARQEQIEEVTAC